MSPAHHIKCRLLYSPSKWHHDRNRKLFSHIKYGGTVARMYTIGIPTRYWEVWLSQWINLKVNMFRPFSKVIRDGLWTLDRRATLDSSNVIHFINSTKFNFVCLLTDAQQHSASVDTLKLFLSLKKSKDLPKADTENLLWQHTREPHVARNFYLCFEFLIKDVFIALFCVKLFNVTLPQLSRVVALSSHHVEKDSGFPRYIYSWRVLCLLDEFDSRHVDRTCKNCKLCLRATRWEKLSMRRWLGCCCVIYK